MNLKLRIGSLLNRLFNLLLSAKWFPLLRIIPRGKFWLYDIQRFSGCKNLRVIFDVGANVGQTLNGLVKYFPNASIYCFEPVQSSFTELTKNYGAHSNVAFSRTALGKEVGTSHIDLHENSELNTLVINQPRVNDLTGVKESIFIDTINNFCSSQNIPSIDILKMDVQGWEMEVLKGASSLILNENIRCIFAEVGFRKADNDMQQFSELNDFLVENGFWLCGFYDCFRWGPNKEYFGFANALYINRAIKWTNVY